jgi:hypothetical protein
MSKRRQSHTCSKDGANGTAPVSKSIEPMTLGNMRANGCALVGDTLRSALMQS